jgi:hypothetical protein
MKFPARQRGAAKSACRACPAGAFCCVMRKRRKGRYAERNVIGSARLGSARLGSARLGSARLGSAASVAVRVRVSSIKLQDDVFFYDAYGVEM